jgi:aryl-phospho-beta-D-glucosidase BglC (GH1 family)
MKKIFYYFFLLSIFSSLLVCQTNNFFSSKGKEIVDLNGNPILIKGINLGNWLVPEGYFIKFKEINSPTRIYNFFNVLLGPSEAKKFWQQYYNVYITKDDIKLIKKLGFNSVRVPFHYALFVNCENKLEGIGYNLLDNLINWCKEENISVLLDMHCAPGGQTGDNIDDSFGYPFLFESKEDRQLTIDIWVKLAEKYANEPIILGYDFLNEPIAHYFDKEKLNPLLEPFFIELTKAVRKVDPNHLIFIAGAQWNSNFSIFGKPFDDKLVYSFHKYWTPPTQEVIQDYIDFSNKYNVPIHLGESGENSNEWIDEFRKTLEKNNISWHFWPYKKMDSESCVVSVTKTKKFDEIIKFANSKSLSYEEIRNNKPDQNVINKALHDYLENLKIDNCKINDGYLKALGLK